MSNVSYVPPKSILIKYADLLVNFGLNRYKGIKRGEVVMINTPIIAMPLAREVFSKVLESGGHPFIKILDEEISKRFLKISSKSQLSFFPEAYFKGIADTINHSIIIIADEDPLYLKGVDPSNLFLYNKAIKPYNDWLDKKEDMGDYTWTLGIYGTEGMAKEAGLTLKEYWAQIIKACYLKSPDHIGKWKDLVKEQSRIIHKLNRMPINKIHMVSDSGIDLWLTLGEKRRWDSGSGFNIPSFEIFTSPDCRGTEGKIHFDLPLYYQGSVIKDIHLTFKKGKVTSSRASKGGNILKELLNQKGANMVGEFSLTDKRFSNIDRFMADTLFDENFGGKFGNTHIALGASYHDTYDGDKSSMNKIDYKKLGFNDSAIHMDIVSTEDRKVHVILKDGTERTIYSNGSFTI